MTMTTGLYSYLLEEEWRRKSKRKNKNKNEKKKNIDNAYTGYTVYILIALDDYEFSENNNFKENFDSNQHLEPEMIIRTIVDLKCLIYSQLWTPQIPLSFSFHWIISGYLTVHCTHLLFKKIITLFVSPATGNGKRR